MPLFQRNLKPTQQLLWLLFGALFGLIISTAVQMLMLLSGHTGMAAMMAMQCLSQGLMFLVPGLLAAWLGGSPRQRRRTPWLAALAGTAAFLLLVPCLDTLTQWNQAWPLPHSAALEASEQMLEQWLMRPSGAALAQNLVVVALVPALCEECFFRLGLQRILCRWWGSEWLGVAVTALVFSLAHGDMFGLVPRFLMGLVLGLLYLRTGSMLVNISAHCANNALVTLCYWLYAKGSLATNLATEGLPLHWALTLALTLAGVALLAVVCRSPKFAKSTATTA